MDINERKQLWEQQTATGITPRELFRSMGNKGYDPTPFISSELGGRTIENFETQFLSADGMAPEVLEYWKRHGMIKEVHVSEDEVTWACYIPESARVNEDTRVPLLFIMNAPNPKKGQIFGLESHGYVNEAAKRGHMAVIMDYCSVNDFRTVYDYIIENYPVDIGRVFITGFSGGGELASLISLSYPELFAGAAPAGNHLMLSSHFISMEQLEKVRLLRLPVILITGIFDISEQLPLYRDTRDLYDRLPDKEYTFKNVWMPRHSRVKMEVFRGRLRVMRCREVTDEECYACEYSGNIVDRAIGAPADRREERIIGGISHFIGDFIDFDGNDYLRVVCLDKAPHYPVPTYASLTFDFFERFRRDTDSGRLIEIGRSEDRA